VIAGLWAGDIEPLILILSALGRTDDRMTGLRAGGGDYLTKSYAFSELLPRIEVLYRHKSSRATETIYRVCDLELD